MKYRYDTNDQTFRTIQQNFNVDRKINRGPGHSYLEAAQKAREERRKIKEQRLRKKMRKAKKKVI